MSEIWDIIIANFLTFLLVLARVAGIFTLNPIFGRNNVPTMAKTGMTLAIAVIMTASMNYTYTEPTTLVFIVDILKEGIVGIVLGFYINLILTIFIYAGEIIDMQIGLGMAKIMEPSSGVSMPMFATFYYYYFIFYFFAVNGHLSYIKLFALSYDSLPMGFKSININVAHLLASSFNEVMQLAVKFAFPILVTGLLVEAAMGVLMKAVPTIHIFVVNIQVKILVGLLVLTIFAQPMSDYVDYVMDIMWGNLQALIPLIGSS